MMVSPLWLRYQQPTKGTETTAIGEDLTLSVINNLSWSNVFQDPTSRLGDGCGSIGGSSTFLTTPTKRQVSFPQVLTDRSSLKINPRLPRGINLGGNRDQILSSSAPRTKPAMSVLVGSAWIEGEEESSSIIPLVEIQHRSEFSVASGGFSDIYIGYWKGAQVGIKMLRTFTSQNSEKIERRLHREIKIWRRLRDPNIATFYGVVCEPNGRTGIVMHWYKNGTAPNYIAQRRGRVDIKTMLLDIGRGLQYLHSLNPPIVHGDLKGCNTLVTDSGRVVISDFGLSRLVREVHGPSGRTTTTVAGSLRFQAPELLAEETPGFPGYPVVPRFPSDIYAFGCTIYELVTGQVPYQNLKADWHVIKAIIQGMPPLQHDDNLIRGSPGLEGLLKNCWQFSPEGRPSIGLVLESLRWIQFVSLECRFQ